MPEVLLSSGDLGRINRKLTALAQSGGRPPIKAMMAYQIGSVQRSFDQGGRPQRWKPLAPSTLDQKLAQGYSPQPLIRKGEMKQKIVGDVVGSDNFKVYPQAPYAPFHHFGTRTIPARPFMVFLDEDVRIHAHLWMEHLRKQGKRIFR